jgi:citrate synthase
MEQAMVARDMSRWETSISEIRSSDAEEEIEVRGRSLSELVGRVSFSEMTYLLLVGRLPTPSQGKVLEALLVASMEHGISPPSMVARCFASYGTSLQAAIGGGVISFGEKMGGAGEWLAQHMFERVGKATAERGQLDEASLEAIAEEMIGDARARKQRLPGFGIPLHKRDPRSPILLDLARQEGVFGTYCKLATMLQDRIRTNSGASVPLNLDGVAAALILDLGIPWQAARLFIIMPRTVSMTAHYLEESAQDSHWRHLREDQIRYAGR